MTEEIQKIQSRKQEFNALTYELPSGEHVTRRDPYTLTWFESYELRYNFKIWRERLPIINAIEATFQKHDGLLEPIEDEESVESEGEEDAGEEDEVRSPEEVKELYMEAQAAARRHLELLFVEELPYISSADVLTLLFKIMKENEADSDDDFLQEQSEDTETT